jgi:hypothetical protein
MITKPFSCLSPRSRALGKISLHSRRSRYAERVDNLLKVINPAPTNPITGKTRFYYREITPFCTCFSIYIAAVNKYHKKVIAVIKSIAEIQSFIFH